MQRAAWGLALAALILYVVRQWAGNLDVELPALGATAASILTGAPVLDGHGPIHGLAEAVVTVGVILLWTAGAMLLLRWRAVSRFAPDELPMLLVSFAAVVGVAGLVTLLFAAISPVRVDPIVPLAALASVAIVGVVQGRRTPKALDELAGKDPQRANAVRLVLMGVAALAAATVIGPLIRDILYVALFKPPASGDEAYFWWRGTEELFHRGFFGYMARFDVSGYSPSYPIAANILVGWVPSDLFEAAGRALPFLFGWTALWLVLGKPVASKRLLPSLAVYLVIGYVLFFNHEWIHSLFFQLWYGDAPAAITFALLLILLDRARQSDQQQQLTPLLIVLSLGMGALAALTKPPLSVLLLPAILPTVAIAGMLIRRPASKSGNFIVAVIAIFCGALVTQLLWAGQLAAFDRRPEYAIALGSLLAFNPTGSIAKLVPYFFNNYQIVWVIFLLTSAMALVADWRRFVPFWLVSLGMIASVLVLYLGVWSTVEHESGARYILHGAYGWIIYALGALYPKVAVTVDQWTSPANIADVTGRLRRRMPHVQPLEDSA
jgi:hypothetical protein